MQCVRAKDIRFSISGERDLEKLKDMIQTSKYLRVALVGSMVYDFLLDTNQF